MSSRLKLDLGLFHMSFILIGLVDQLEYVLLMAVAKVQDASRNTKTLKPWINPGKTVTSGPLPLNKTVAQQD